MPAVEENRVDATHERDGWYYTVIYCSVCNEVLESTEYTLDKLVHETEVVVENRTEATCYSEGSYDEVVYCLDTDCDHKELSRKKVTLEKIAHTPATAVIENKIEAKCTVDGSYDEVVYCSVANCKELISKTTRTIPATGHTFGEWEIVKLPTGDEEGLKERVCICNAKDTEVIDTLFWSLNLEYELNEDGVSYSVVGMGSCSDAVVVIPPYLGYQGTMPVTGIKSLYNILGNDHVTSIVIPESITNITSVGVAECENVNSILVSSQNPAYKSIDGNLYTKDGKTLVQYAGGKTNESFNLPDNVTSVGLFAFSNANNLTSISVASGNTAYKSINGNLYTKDGKTLVKYATGKTDESFVIPEGVTSICAFAFNNCVSLTSIKIPDGLKSIGQSAFYGCAGLTGLALPDSITTIDMLAFYGCTSLTRLVIPDGVTSIGKSTLGDCDSLTSVVIPSSVTSIGEGAFYGTPADDIDIYYTGSRWQWQQISIFDDFSNDYVFSRVTIHYDYIPE